MTIRIPITLSVALSVLLTLVAAVAAPLFAQEQYKAWEIDPAQAAKRAEYFNSYKAGNRVQAAEQDAFFDSFYFARWTDPASMGLVQGYAREFISKDLAEARGTGRDTLLTKSLATLQKMAADGTVTPTARLNAMLAIGQLNQQEAPSRNDRPVPYPAALTLLVQEYKNQNAPEYIRVAALTGLVRHAQVGIADASMKNNTVPTLFIETIRSGKPTADRSHESQEMFDWYRWRAMEGLGALKTVGANGLTVTVLIEVIENIDESMATRTKAARTIGELDFSAAVATQVPVNYQRIGTLLIALAKSACDQELQKIQELIDKDRAGGGGGAMAMGRGGGMEDMGMSMGPMMGAGGGPNFGVPFASLPPEKQSDVMSVVQRIKAYNTDILFGMRGTRFVGATTEGIVAVMANEDPIAKKLTETGRAMDKLFKFLDDGPPLQPNMGVPMAPPTPRPGSTGPAGGPRQPARPMLKVNLTTIQSELQVFGTALDAIISGV